MARTATALALLAAAALAAGCASSNTLYAWGGYNTVLYRHYKNPQDREAFVENLEEIIRKAEESGKKVPPGIYAEYGYALYEVGRYADASPYFRREMDEWPESRVFMEKMIRNAERAGGPRGAPAPGGPTVAPGGGTKGGAP